MRGKRNAEIPKFSVLHRICEWGYKCTPTWINSAPGFLDQNKLCYYRAAHTISYKEVFKIDTELSHRLSHSKAQTVKMGL